jgi:hypothetical protein
MMLLVSGATRTVEHYKHSPYLGHLLTPGNGNDVAAIVATGLPFAADNGCFNGLDEPAYRAMLGKVAGQGPLWVTVPDVVADAGATAALFERWAPVVEGYGLPLAYVAQDGLVADAVPWGCIRCLFIGGSTGWKLGADAAQLVLEAKRRGLLVHVGRVNSFERMARFAALGADTFDGSKHSMFPDRWIPHTLRELATLAARYGGHQTARQLRLEFAL